MRFSQVTSRETHRRWQPTGALTHLLGQGGLVPARGRASGRDEHVSRAGQRIEPQFRADKPIVRVEGGPLPPDLCGAVIALGNFDGFHFGHQAVVGRAVAMARERGVAAIAATFDPHPVRYFTPEAAPFRLTTLEQRQRMFAAAGVDAMMVFHFNGTLANVTPEDFVQHWLAGAGGVVTGSGFCFGRKRSGTVGALAQLAAQQGMACEAIDPVAIDGQVVSSSRIRQALRDGECATAERLLTRPFAVCGYVQHAEQAVDRFGCNTLTINLEGYVRPLAGAYSARLRLLDGRSLRCVVHCCPSLAESLHDGVLRVDCPGLWQKLDAQAVEVEFIGRLPVPAGECVERSSVAHDLQTVFA